MMASAGGIPRGSGQGFTSNKRYGRGFPANLYVRLLGDALRAYCEHNKDKRPTVARIVWSTFGPELFDENTEIEEYRRFFLATEYRWRDDKAETSAIPGAPVASKMTRMKDSCIKNATFNTYFSYARKMFSNSGDGLVDFRAYNVFMGLSLSYGEETIINDKGAPGIKILTNSTFHPKPYFQYHFLKSNSPSFHVAMKLGIDTVLIQRKIEKKMSSDGHRGGNPKRRKTSQDDTEFESTHYCTTTVILEAMYKAWEWFFEHHNLPSIADIFTYLLYFDVTSKQLMVLPKGAVLGQKYSHMMYIRLETTSQPPWLPVAAEEAPKVLQGLDDTNMDFLHSLVTDFLASLHREVHNKANFMSIPNTDPHGSMTFENHDSSGYTYTREYGGLEYINNTEGAEWLNNFKIRQGDTLNQLPLENYWNRWSSSATTTMSNIQQPQEL